MSLTDRRIVHWWGGGGRSDYRCDIIDSVIRPALCKALPVWKTTQILALHRESSIPPTHIIPTDPRASFIRRAKYKGRTHPMGSQACSQGKNEPSSPAASTTQAATSTTRWRNPPGVGSKPPGGLRQSCVVHSSQETPHALGTRPHARTPTPPPGGAFRARRLRGVPRTLQPPGPRDVLPLRWRSVKVLL